jgi:hypothetical protein
MDQNSSSAGIARDDPRSRGYTVIADQSFANLDDMKYYDTECPAHTVLKTAIKEFLAEPPLVIYTDGGAMGMDTRRSRPQ